MSIKKIKDHICYKVQVNYDSKINNVKCYLKYKFQIRCIVLKKRQILPVYIQSQLLIHHSPLIDIYLQLPFIHNKTPNIACLVMHVGSQFLHLLLPHKIKLSYSVYCIWRITYIQFIFQQTNLCAIGDAQYIDNSFNTKKTEKILYIVSSRTLKHISSFSRYWIIIPRAKVSAGTYKYCWILLYYPHSILKHTVIP